jgi:hypothetical protein
MYICRRLVGWRDVIAGRPAPTVERAHLKETGRLSGRHRGQARSHRVRCTLQESGRLSGRHRQQASSHNKNRGTPPAPHHSTGRAVARLQLLILIRPSLWNAERPGLHSHAERRERSWGGRKRLVGWPGAIAAMRRPDKPAPTINRGTPPAPHHSTGRAVARLQLLIYPPLRQAEWRRSSGGGRVAPCGEAALIERRSSRSRPEAMPPDECRNEGTPSLSEGPDVGASLFFAYFF